MPDPVNRQWLLGRRPKGLVSAEDFRWVETPVPELNDGEVLVRNVYLSCDPTQRSWMAGKTYMPAVKLGEVMRSFSGGRVEASRDPGFQPGDLVYGMCGWQDYGVARPTDLFPIRKVPVGASIEEALGVFGLTGLTAYFGLTAVGEVKPGETVVVSGAAGATGSVVGQIAKTFGCNVVGIAGGPGKCSQLTGELGFDAAIDYKSENIMTRLRETCPKGIDLFFDNVGGRILDAALMHLALHARVVICGSISGYNDETPPDGPRNYMQLLVRRSRMQGFVMTDYNDRIPEATDALSGWVRAGRIKHTSDVMEGLENAPAALARLFSGENRGKQLVRVAEHSGGGMTAAPSGPFYFGPMERRLFGWLHAAPAEDSDVGVVLCNPFGFEALCTHRSFRHFAESFARAGFPALRFDYDGTGDSAGTDRDPGRVRAWIESIHRAVEALEERTGVRRVCLFGLRLGATLATAAAAERSDVAGLIAIVPVVSPEQYLRELQALQAWGKLEKSPDGVTGLQEGDQEAAGFVVTAETGAGLVSLEMTRATKAPAPRVLLIERADRKPTGAWAEKLQTLGAEVMAARIAGYTEMNWDPHKAVVPQAMIAASVAWLEGVREADRDSPERPRREPSGEKTVSSPASELEPEPGVVESPVFIDGARNLFGVLARPRTPAREGRGARGILILNAGAQHRIGPNRLWVTLARHWAKLGVVVLRLDVSGLGDSRARSGEEENAVYTGGGSADIADAVAWLRREWNVERCDAIGLCGSAYQAFKAAVRGPGLENVFAINQQVFFWDPDAPVANVAGTKAASEVARYKQVFFKADSWKKLLRGKVKIRAAGEVFRKRFVDFTLSRGRRVARRLGVPLENDLATELARIAKHRVRLRFVFTDGEAGEQLLHELGGSVVGRLEKKGVLRIDTIRGADHTFTAVWTHGLLRDRLDEWLDLRR